MTMAFLLFFIAAPLMLILIIAYFCGGLYAWAFLGMTDYSYGAMLIETLLKPAALWGWEHWYVFAGAVLVLGVIDGIRDGWIPGGRL